MRTPSLSFAITTRGPAGRVRALLELVRPHVDEIVLAADRDGDPDVLDACADLADQRLRFELRDSPAKLVGWIQHQCSADWILRLDDDEVPSAALLRELPELLAERRVSEVAFPRRWLYGSSQRWIDSPPWRVEYQGRLVRNVPGLWTFEGRVHTVGVVHGERRLVASPMYHADLLLSSLEDRRRKSLRYEAEDPGAVWDSFPVNGMYLPEQIDDLSTAAVPAEDRTLIERVLGARPPDLPARPPGGVRYTDFAEVNRFNTTSRPSAAALRGHLEWVAPPTILPAGTRVHHDVRVRNLGDALWRAGATPPSFEVVLRCRDSVTGQILSEYRESFTETIWPGQETVLLLTVDTPPEPGAYTLEVDLAHGERRFGDGARAQVQVFPAVTAAGLNGSLEAVAEAGHAGRVLYDSDRRRRDLDAVADDLRATRRYRILNALARRGRQPTQDEAGA